jgi:hypothetical protein
MGRLSSCEWGVGEENNDKSPMSKVTMKMGAMGGRLLGGGLKCRGGGVHLMQGAFSLSVGVI